MARGTPAERRTAGIRGYCAAVHRHHDDEGVWIEESVNERWEQREDGSEQLRRETVYLPTYEYTVNGKTYRYASRQTVSGKRELGRQVVGYYDPTRPDRITENKPRKPVLGGMCFFMFAAFLLWFGIMSFAGMLSIS